MYAATPNMTPYATITRAENGYSVVLCLPKDDDYGMDTKTYVFPTMGDTTDFIAKKLK